MKIVNYVLDYLHFKKYSQIKRIIFKLVNNIKNNSNYNYNY